MSFDINSVPLQSGRIAIITGANVGLGLETARTFIEKDITVIMACRSLEKAEAARTDLLAAKPDAKLDIMPLDLSDLKSVRNFAEQFKSKYNQLDLLINNAGVMIPPYEKTVDGFELQMGANYFGHFLLTSLLLPELENAEGARIVNLSSIAHRSGRIHFNDIHFEKSYSRWKAYGQSKLAMLMFSFELDRQLKSQGSKTISVAAHPGVSDTNLSRYIPKWLIVSLYPIFKLMTQTPANGALPQIYAALGEDIKSGDYTGPDGFNEMAGKPVKVDSLKHAKDLAVAKKLWDKSVELTGAEWSSSKSANKASEEIAKPEIA